MASAEHIQSVLWACEVADHALAIFEDVFPKDKRPRRAIEAGRSWARGGITVTDARAAAFAAHAAAREAKDASEPYAEAAARAAGHAAATAHVVTHAPYACKYARKACDDPVIEDIWQKIIASLDVRKTR